MWFVLVHLANDLVTAAFLDVTLRLVVEKRGREPDRYGEPALGDRLDGLRRPPPCRIHEASYDKGWTVSLRTPLFVFDR